MGEGRQGSVVSAPARVRARGGGGGGSRGGSARRSEGAVVSGRPGPQLRVLGRLQLRNRWLGRGGGGHSRQVGRESDESSALPPPPPQGPALRLPLQRPDDLSREGAESRGPGRSPAPPLLCPLPSLTWSAAAWVTPIPPPPRPPSPPPPRPTRDLPARGCSG